MVIGVFSLILFIFSYLNKNVSTIILSILIFLVSLGLYKLNINKKEYPHHKVIKQLYEHKKHKIINHKIHHKKYKKRINIFEIIKDIIVSPIIWSLITLITIITSIILFNRNFLYAGLFLAIITSLMSGYRARMLIKKRRDYSLIFNPILWSILTITLILIGIIKQKIIILYLGFGTAFLTVVIIIIKIIKLLKNNGIGKSEKHNPEIADKIQQMKKLIKEPLTKYETDLDKLCRILDEYKKIKISEIMQTFNINQKRAEEWSKILKEHDMAEIHYPAIGEAELICKK